MYKNKITIILIIGALINPVLALAEDEKPKGPPNSVREQRTKGDSNNRQSVRKPRQRGNSRAGGKQGESKPQATGTTRRTESRGHHHRHGIDVKEALSLSDEQAAQLRTIHERWHKFVKPIHSDAAELQKEIERMKDLARRARFSPEGLRRHNAKLAKLEKELAEKKAKLKEAFKRMDAAVRRVLSEEQYAKLVKLRRDRSRPQEHPRKNQKRR